MLDAGPALDYLKYKLSTLAIDHELYWMIQYEV